ncbi:head decoration protein [Marinomonas mediterranea]|jgi:hypothetical protein|uniref:Hypothetical phage-related protein n=1 Tax=Marinomonas mediterranea (strain ATCC 700492 / JCM 21426 / NBRC 103028 / MMB-1) TaxID=717774 RepID=F2K217_MARM1|nr:head decoration protein [Marinomonas mediterranea]ADZ91095.1 hypothetical phage-related protein [Marinomonas mediterranea MMB-1]WCN13156.1 head decoration protein [Marinomonas mediterranea]WCN17227.1 head decoration protein [Marinomonas mediterranea MMB-1]
MVTKTKAPGAGQYIVEEVGQYLSRDKKVITAGKYSACTVMGKVSASSKFKQLDPTVTDGAENASAILFDAVDASSGDVEGVLSTALTAARASDLVWPEGISDAQKTAAIAKLAVNGIKVV